MSSAVVPALSVRPLSDTLAAQLSERFGDRFTTSL